MLTVLFAYVDVIREPQIWFMFAINMLGWLVISYLITAFKHKCLQIKTLFRFGGLLYPILLTSCHNEARGKVKLV